MSPPSRESNDNLASASNEDNMARYDIYLYPGLRLDLRRGILTAARLRVGQNGQAGAGAMPVAPAVL